MTEPKVAYRGRLLLFWLYQLVWALVTPFRIILLSSFRALPFRNSWVALHCFYPRTPGAENSYATGPLAAPPLRQLETIPNLALALTIKPSFFCTHSVTFATGNKYTPSSPPKNVHVFIFLNNCQKLTDFNNFRSVKLLNPEKI